MNESPKASNKEILVEKLLNPQETHLTPEETERIKYIFERLSKETTSTIRHALAIHADYIVVLDKSARDYGYIFLKLIPDVIKEYAKEKGITSEEVKVPEVKYLNPSTELNSSLSSEYDFSPEETDDQQMKKMFVGKKVLVFDEASDKNERHYYEVHDLNSEAQYDFWNIDLNNDDFAQKHNLNSNSNLVEDKRKYYLKKRKQWFGEEHVPHPGGPGLLKRKDYRPKSIRFTEWLHNRYDAQTDVHIGECFSSGGWLYTAFEYYAKHKGLEKISELQYSIEKDNASLNGKKILDSDNSDLISGRNKEFSVEMFNEYFKPVLDTVLEIARKKL